MQDIITLATLHRQYLEFMANPAAQVAVVQTSTDPDYLFANGELFYDLLQKQAVPALILQPHRFGALWMADRYAQIMGRVPGRDIWLAGLRGASNEYTTVLGEQCVAVTTCEQILKNHDLLTTTTAIVLCNTQEATLAQSLVKAIIKQRIARGEKIFLVILTTSGNQAALDREYYCGWAIMLDGRSEPTPTIACATSISSYEAPAAPPGSTPSKVWFTDASCQISDAAVQALQSNIVQTGLVVCVGAYPVARQVEAAISKLITQQNLPHIEAVILQESTIQDVQRQALMRPAEGTIRVLINVGVLEASGICVLWANGVISDGLQQHYIATRMSGGVETMCVDASQQRVLQQWQINSGEYAHHYALYSSRSFDERCCDHLPELDTLPHTAIVLQTIAAGFDTLELDVEFSFDVLGLTHRVLRLGADQLCQLGLLQQERLPSTPNGPEFRWSLTKGGQLTCNAAIGIYSRAVFMTAAQLGIIDVILPVIAIMEVGGVRRVPMLAHGLDNESDLLDSAKAFITALSASDLSKAELVERYNVDFYRMQQAQRVLVRLRRLCAVAVPYAPYLLEGGVASDNPVLRQQIKTCLFAAFGPNVFIQDTHNRRRTWRAIDLQEHSVGTASVLARQVFSSARVVLTGLPRVVMARTSNKQFTIVEHVTMYTDVELLFIAQTMPHLLRTFRANKRTTSVFHGDAWLTDIAVEQPHDQSIVPGENTMDTRPNADSLDAIQLEVLSDTTTNPLPPAPTDNGMSAMVSQLASAWGAKTNKKRS